MVTFRDPNSGGGFYVDEGRYKAKLIRLDETEGQSFDGKPPQPRIIWNFHLWGSDGEIVEDDHGLPMEFRVYTSQALGEKSNARPIAEALLSKALDGMTGEEVAELVIGKMCSVMIADQKRPDDSVRSTAMSWKALTTAKAGAKKAPPAEEPDDEEEEV